MKVHEFINSANWCQRALCMDADGNKWAWPHGLSIVKWCFSGMMIHCYPGNESLLLFERVKNHLFNTQKEADGNIGRWNDHPERTWEQVRDLAIELDI